MEKNTLARYFLEHWKRIENGVEVFIFYFFPQQSLRPLRLHSDHIARV